MIFSADKNLDRFFFRFVTIHAFDRQTDGQNHRNLIARPRLHSMQCGKNDAGNTDVDCSRMMLVCQRYVVVIGVNYEVYL